MDFLGSRYYKLNQRLLLLVGLWPYDRSIFKYCQAAFCNINLALMIICQIAKMIALRRDIELVLKIIAPALLCTICAIKYQTFYIIAGKIRHLMDYVEHDWNMLKDKNELEIIGRYTYIGSLCTLSFAIIGFVCALICILLPFVPIVLDVFAPLNVSRPRQFLFPGEYFVDQRRYFYAILLHIDITFVVGIITLLGTESLYVTHVQHACGMFRIASYRMNQAFDNKVLRAHAPEERAAIVCKGIIEAVYIHKRAIEFSEFLWSSMALSYCVMLIIGVTSLTLHLFCLFQALIFMKETAEILKLIIFIFAQIFYFFLGNYVGQILIDHSTSLFQKTYITRWHGAPLQAQKLLLMIMQRSMKSCKMDMGGIFVPSFEGFVTIMSMTMSYFMVLWSTHK